MCQHIFPRTAIATVERKEQKTTGDCGRGTFLKKGSPCTLPQKDTDKFIARGDFLKNPLSRSP